MKAKWYQWCACLVWIAGFGLIGEDVRAGQGAAGLLVAPTRVVFEGSRRSAALTLINTGNEVATYRISFIQMEMTEAGQIVEIEEDEADGPFADRLIRYSPRQVTLKPHTPQTVRMRLRKPAELAPGEYRSHLLFRAIPSARSSTTLIESSKPRSDSVVQIELIPIYGLAIPVIVRHGKTAATARLTKLSLRAGLSPADPPILSLQISRDGNRSVCGNVTVTHVNAGGQEQVVGRVDRVAVYTPTPLRRLDVSLKLPPGLTLKDGRLRVTYAEAGEANNETLAEAEIILEAQPEAKPVMVEKP